MNNETPNNPVFESILDDRFLDDCDKERLVTIYNQGYSGKFAAPSDLLGRKAERWEWCAFWLGKTASEFPVNEPLTDKGPQTRDLP